MCSSIIYIYTHTHTHYHAVYIPDIPGSQIFSQFHYIHRRFVGIFSASARCTYGSVATISTASTGPSTGWSSTHPSVALWRHAWSISNTSSHDSKYGWHTAHHIAATNTDTTSNSFWLLVSNTSTNATTNATSTSATSTSATPSSTKCPSTSRITNVLCQRSHRGRIQWRTVGGFQSFGYQSFKVAVGVGVRSFKIFPYFVGKPHEENMGENWWKVHQLRNNSYVRRQLFINDFSSTSVEVKGRMSSKLLSLVIPSRGHLFYPFWEPTVSKFNASNHGYWKASQWCILYSLRPKRSFEETVNEAQSGWLMDFNYSFANVFYVTMYPSDHTGLLGKGHSRFTRDTSDIILTSFIF